MVADTTLLLERDHIKLSIKNVRKTFNFKDSLPDALIAEYILLNGEGERAKEIWAQNNSSP